MVVDSVRDVRPLFGSVLGDEIERQKTESRVLQYQTLFCMFGREQGRERWMMVPFWCKRMGLE